MDLSPKVKKSLTSNMKSKFNPYLITAVLECTKKNPFGFTIAPDMLTEPVEGYAVACLATQGLHGTIGFLRALALALEYGMHFGGWLDTETGVWYWDAVHVFPMGQLREATQYAKDQRQIAFFDIANGVEIRL